ncbi:hypothetical protein C5S53_13090 [Methanophagales archaeon]|nr:hypothetical protein C5S53_13090 [Methanophagales archaeon]
MNKIFVPLTLLALIALGVAILFTQGHKEAITIIIFFIPAVLAVSFLVQYIVTKRGRNIKDKVMERDIMSIAEHYTELMRTLHDFEDKYGPSTKDFRVALGKVKDGLSDLGCEVNGKIRIEKAKIKKVAFADLDWIRKTFGDIRKQYEIILYSHALDKCKEYLESTNELESEGYKNIHDQIEKMETKIRGDDRVEIDALEISIFMNEFTSILDEALRICLRDATSLEGEGKEIADTARVRTNIKLVEHSIELGNYENATKVLISMIERLTGVLKEEFGQYKEDTLELLKEVAGISDTVEEEGGRDIEWLKKNIDACVEPSEMRKLRKHNDTLIKTSLTALEGVYNKIFELEREIADGNPATDVYPVEYWAIEKRNEIDELKSMPKSDVPAYTRRYRLFASDAHSRLEYDAERLQYIKKGYLK